MALDKYNGFVAGDILPAENVNSVDPDNIESPVANEAFRIIRTNENGLMPSELLEGVDASGMANVPGGYNASDALLISTDAEVLKTGNTYTEVRAFIVPRGGQFRIKFEIKYNNGVVYGRIYRNGVAVGTEQSVSAGGYVVKSEDIAGFSGGDRISLYLKGDGAGVNCYAQNFRLYGTKVSAFSAPV